MFPGGTIRPGQRTSPIKAINDISQSLYQGDSASGTGNNGIARGGGQLQVRDHADPPRYVFKITGNIATNKYTAVEVRCDPQSGAVSLIGTGGAVADAQRPLMEIDGVTTVPTNTIVSAWKNPTGEVGYVFKLGTGNPLITVKDFIGTPSYANITSLEFSGATVSQPGAGRAKVTIASGGGGADTFTGIPNVSLTVPVSPSSAEITNDATTYETLGAGTVWHVTASIPCYLWLDATSPVGAIAQIWVQLYDATAMAYIGNRYLLLSASTPDIFTWGTGSISAVVSAVTSTALQLEFTVVSNMGSGDAVINAAQVYSNVGNFGGILCGHEIL